MAATVDLKELIEHSVHFGHRTCFWEPKMAPYIYGKKSKDLHIINLLKTRPLFQKALNEIEAVAANNGKILLVSTKRIAQQAIEQAAEKCEMPCVNKRWPGGMLTNFKTILKSVKKMRQLEEFIKSDEFAAMKKKERLSVQRELGKLQASFNGIRDMTSLPDMLFVIDVGHEHIAIKEAKKLGIPVVGIVDTNCSPEDIDYVIPGNDDSQKAINLYTRLVAETIDVAREKIRAKLKAAQVKMEGSTRVEVVKKSTKKVDQKPELDEAEEPSTVTPDETVSQEVAKKPATEKKIIRVVAKPKKSPEKPPKAKAETTTKKTKATASKTTSKATEKAIAKKPAAKKTVASKKAATSQSADKKPAKSTEKKAASKTKASATKAAVKKPVKKADSEDSKKAK